MNTEKAYLSMKRTGVSNIVLGIVAICCGITTGVLLLVSGVSLMKKKKYLSF